MADRGAYRAVKVVLLDGPDFQALPERANHLFLALKLSVGVSGIEVRYPEALAHELAAKTRIPVEAVREALGVLEADGWIRREGNIIWVVGQLEHDPGMQNSNENHRKSVQRHVAGLPRLPIVLEYIHAHPDWFPSSEVAGWIAMPMPSGSHPDATAITEKEVPKNEEPETEEGDSDESPPEPNDPVPALWCVWLDELGGKPPQPKLTPKRRKKLRSLYLERLKREEDPPEAFRKILRAVQRSDHHMSKRQYHMPESLFRSPERRDHWYLVSLNGDAHSDDWADRL